MSWSSVLSGKNPDSGWPLSQLSGDAIDSFGSNDLTVPAGITRNVNGLVIDASGDPDGKCFTLPGTGDNFLTSSLAVSTAGSFSDLIWFASTAGGSDILISQQNGGGGSGTNHLILVDGSIATQIGGATLTGPSSEFNDGNPHFAVLSFDNATGALKVWVDNVLEIDQTVTETGAIGLLNFGANKNGSGEWVGQLDEPAFFSRALGPSDVSSLWAAGRGQGQDDIFEDLDFALPDIGLGILDSISA